MSKNKRILILFNAKSSIYGFRSELINRLINESYALLISSPEGEIDEDKVSSQSFQFLPTPVDRRGLNPLKDFKLFLAYKKYIKTYNPHMVLSFTIKPNIYGGLACRITKKKHIGAITGLGTSIQNGGFLSKLVLFLYKTGLRKTRKVFFENTSDRNFCVTEKIATFNKTIVVSGAGINLIDHPLEFYVSEKEQTIKLLFIGRIMKAKGVGELLKAIPMVRKTNTSVFCDLVGSFEELSFEPLIKHYESAGHGKYLGISKDVHNLVKQYHAVVLPSYHEGMANVLLEAAACGRPILASNIPGCRETFDEGISGLGFEPKSVNSLASVIERFIYLPHEEKVKMGLSGRKKMEEEFDRQIVVDTYMKEIESIFNEEGIDCETLAK